MITVHRDDGDTVVFATATRVSTDEHNNLEVWDGSDGERLVWLCAAEHWVDVKLGDDGD